MQSAACAYIGYGFGVGSMDEGATLIRHGDFAGGLGRIGYGTLLATGGLIATLDIPMSLAGDILTLPIAYARSKDLPWARWWGEKSSIDRLPANEEGAPKTRERDKPSDAPLTPR